MVEITITNRQRKIRINQKEAIRLARLILRQKRHSFKHVSILITTNSEIKKLNKRFLGKGSPTDVLSFKFSQPRKMPGPVAFLGDVAVSSDMAIKNAKIYKATAGKELFLYIIHGLLHLLGYDDQTTKERAVMRRKEQFYLQMVKG